MTDFFVAKAGTVIKLASSDKVAEAVVSIDSLNGSGKSVIITSIAMDSQTSVQFSPTIGGPEYLYVFGERLSDTQVTFALYSNAGCDEGGDHGVTDFLNYYDNNKVTADKATPITIAYLGQTIKGFLIGCRVSTQTGSDGLPISTGTLTLKTYRE